MREQATDSGTKQEEKQKADPTEEAKPPSGKLATNDALKREVHAEVHAEVQKQVSATIREELKPLVKVMKQLVHTSISNSAAQHNDAGASEVLPEAMVEHKNLEEREDQTISQVDAMIRKVDAEIAEAKLHGAGDS